MKDLWKSGVAILLIVGVLYIIFLRECKRPVPCPAPGEIIIKQSVWDSIKAVASMQPIVKTDTIWLKGDTVYVYTTLPTPTPDPDTPEINHYADSLVKQDIDVRVNFSVKGELLSWEWMYRPIIKLITVDSIIYKPYPVEVEKIVFVPRGGLYGHVSLGGNTNAFIFGGGVDLITKKETQIGYEYQRFGSENFHSIRIGAAIFKRKK